MIEEEGGRGGGERGGDESSARKERGNESRNYSGLACKSMQAVTDGAI